MLGSSSSSDDWLYWPVNAVILGLGLGLNRLGARSPGAGSRYAAA